MIHPVVDRVGAALFVSALLLTGCSTSDSPTNEVFALVDLSETWFNPATTQRNEGVLREVGEGIFEASDVVTPPFAVQYRVIGDASFERPPVCDVVYKPMLVNTSKEKPGWLVTRSKKLERYLANICPTILLNRKPEPLTEISAAIASIGDKPRRAGVKRSIIIISDFLEEAPEKTSLKDYDFKGVRILLLYRPLAREAAASTRQRVTEWRDILQTRGAAIIVMPDTALKRAEIADFVAAR